MHFTLQPGYPSTMSVFAYTFWNIHMWSPQVAGTATGPVVREALPLCRSWRVRRRYIGWTWVIWCVHWMSIWQIYIYIHMYVFIIRYVKYTIHEYIHTCMHACMHACIHTYIHTYINHTMRYRTCLYIQIIDKTIYNTMYNSYLLYTNTIAWLHMFHDPRRGAWASPGCPPVPPCAPPLPPTEAAHGDAWAMSQWR